MFETSPISCITQAEACRRHAADLAGKPDASMLLRIAGYFEELALQSAVGGQARYCDDRERVTPRSRPTG
jgi:hypothetical protein